MIAKHFYRSQLGNLLTDSPKLLPAAAFYLLYPIGILAFASLPAGDAGSLGLAAELGAAFGFFADILNQ